MKNTDYINEIEYQLCGINVTITLVLIIQMLLLVLILRIANNNHNNKEWEKLGHDNNDTNTDKQ